MNSIKICNENRPKKKLTFQLDEGSEEFLKQQMECPVCLEFLHGLIYICCRGHSVCQKCSTKISICPLCRHKMTKPLGRNYFQELFMSQCIFLCKYSENGCQERFLGPSVIQHEKICKYREIKCYKVTRFNCSNIFANSQNFISHLSSYHRIPLFSNSLEYTQRIMWKLSDKFYENVAPSVFLIEFDHRIFLYSCAKFPFEFEKFETFEADENISLTFWWVSILDNNNDHENENNYRCTITISHPFDQNLKTIWTGPVHNFRHKPKEIFSNKECLITNAAYLKSLCSKGGEKNNLTSFIENVLIFKANENANTNG